MDLKSIKKQITSLEQIPIFIYTIKWFLLSLIVGTLSGSASALLLVSLEWARTIRESNLWIISLLPIGGFLVGALYYYFGKDVVKGNNQLIDEYHEPKKVIPFKMAPFVWIGTVITHVFGGSAGREGSAVQMGAAIADQLTPVFKLDKEDRRILIVMGVSAGFASVFGTPLAGTIFALEVLVIGRMRYEAILPSVLTAIIADYACHAWHVGHTAYNIPWVPEMTPINFLWTVFCGIIFAVGAILFSKTTHFWGDFFKKKIQYPPLRPFIGGIVIALAVWLLGTTKYIGLGVPTIAASFTEEMNSYDFLLKILFTSFTLGAGYKGGEVTPLFYVGATLGNALVWFVPLPIALLAGMGFVAVFSGATNTPIACTFMGIELFGAEGGVYIAIACIVSYLFSGHTGIYGSQIIGSPKHLKLIDTKSKTLNEVDL